MDEETRAAILEIRDCMKEMRDILRQQKEAQDQAVRMATQTKENFGRVMEMLPADVRNLMAPLIKMGG